MVELAQILDPALSFAGGAVGAGAIWSLKARGERRMLKRQIISILKQLETPLLNTYEAISTDNHKLANANRDTLDVLSSSLEARLSRYALVHILSDRSAGHITGLTPLTRLLSALGQFADRYTIIRKSKHQGSYKFKALLDLALEEATEFQGIPDALDLIRDKFKLPPLSKEIRRAHADAIEAVEKNRKDIDLPSTEGRDIFLDNR